MFLSPGMKTHLRLPDGWTHEEVEDSCFEKEAFNALEASATLPCMSHDIRTLPKPAIMSLEACTDIRQDSAF